MRLYCENVIKPDLAKQLKKVTEWTNKYKESTNNGNK